MRERDLERDLKYALSFQIKADTATRTVTGVCAVFGHIDGDSDRLHPGAFKEAVEQFKRGESRCRHLWNHDFGKPPIATIKEIREISVNELPEKIKTIAPNATGGLLVTRKYYADTELSEWVWTAIQAGDVTEMSFGFNPKRVEFTSEGEGAAQIRIRELREVQLFDTSDVLWGANDATSADIAKSLLQDVPLEQIAFALSRISIDIKAGRRNAMSDMRLLNAIHAAAIELGCDECLGIKTESPEKSLDRAEAAKSTSLQQAKFRIREIELENLNF